MPTRRVWVKPVDVSNYRDFMNAFVEGIEEEEARASVAMVADFTHTTEEDTEADRKREGLRREADKDSDK